MRIIKSRIFVKTLKFDSLKGFFLNLDFKIAYFSCYAVNLATMRCINFNALALRAI
jgi:hypothetical protein